MPIEDRLNGIFFHVRDDNVELVDTSRERAEANRMEVDNFIAHVLEDTIEGEVVVLAQAELEEVHVLFVFVFLVSELVVEEAAEELDVAFLGVDGQCFHIFRSLVVVVVNCFVMRVKHSEKHQERADHHSSSALACFAVHHNDWRVVVFVAVFLVILLHSL